VSDRSGVSTTPDVRTSDGQFGRFLVDPQFEVFQPKVRVTHRDGERVTPDPSWMSWPMVRGDEFGPPIQSQADLAKATRGKR
jgi:hypothetical protein